jgi:hypothetical protein
VAARAARRRALRDAQNALHARKSAKDAPLKTRGFGNGPRRGAREATNPLVHSIIHFGQYFMVDTAGQAMFALPSAPMHFALDDQLRDTTCPQTVVIAPRGTAKSSIAVETQSLWHIFAEDQYNYDMGLTESPTRRPKYIVIVSKTQREAKSRLDTIKRMLGHEGDYSPRLRAAFGNWGEETATDWTSEEIRLKDGTCIKAMGMRQPGRGLKKKFLRPTLVIVDDAEDEENTLTVDALAKNMRWLEQVIVPSLSDNGRVVVIGTPINTSCMVVKLMDAPDWYSMWFEQDAEGEFSRWTINGEQTFYEGLLWPEKTPREWLRVKRDSLVERGMGASYYREYECKVVGDETQIFRPEDDRFYDGDLFFDAIGQPYMELTALDTGTGHLEALPKPRRVPVFVFTGIDPAATTGESSDKTAICNVAVDADGNMFVASYIHKRLMPLDVIEAIADNHVRVKPFRGVLEVTAAFKFVAEFLWRDHRVRYIEDSPTLKKKGEGSRLERLHPFNRRGRLFTKPSQRDLRDQLHNYPRGDDDLMDALEKAVRFHITPPNNIVLADKPLPPSASKRYYDPMLA